MNDLLGAQPITKRDKIRCLEREIKMRERVYKRWVDIKKMTQTEADHEIACMKAILADYGSS